MLPSDLIVEVRDRTLARVGQVPTLRLSLTATIRCNAPGSWSLRLPADDPMSLPLRQPGAGIVVTGPSGVLFSGPVSAPVVSADAANPDGDLVVGGVTDDVILWNRLAYPTPTTATVTSQTVANDVRTGAAETVMRGYVDANIGASAPAVRKVAGLTQTPNLARGPIVSKSARFDVLGDLLADTALGAGLVFRVVQSGTSLVFDVAPVADRTKTVRFDLHNGTLSSQEVATTAPTVTRAIVAGQGEGVDRTFLERTSADSLAAETSLGPWGRIERFIDQRQTNDSTELATAGDEALTEGGSFATAVKAVPSDDLTMRYAVDWNVGDAVTIVVDGQETTSTVTAASLVMDATAARVGAEIGDVSGFDPNSALGARVEDTASRVSALERTVAAGLPSSLDASVIGSGTLADARIPNLNASKITTGAFADARIPNLNASKITAGTFDNARLEYATGTLATTADFTEYTAGALVTWWRSGRVVTVEGTIKPATAAVATTIATVSATTACTLPAGVRPVRPLTILCQGSSKDSWALGINSGGTITVGRYNGTASTSTWLPFTATFIVP